MRIEGSTVLITGASSGIGLALSREFARAGAILAIASRNEIRLNQVARELQASHPQLRTPVIIGSDVSDRESVHQMIETCIRQLGHIDILVNNAGISVYGDTSRTQLEEFRRVMDVNYFGALNCMLEVLPHMKRAADGLIVNVASLAALHGVPYLGAYSASKAALVALGQSLRAELKGSGVSVMNVYPNYTETEIFEHETKIGGARRPDRPYDSAVDVAKKIVAAIEHDREDLILSFEGKALSVFRGLSPSYVERRMKRIADQLRESQENSHA